ncbi:MAG: phage portal protein [Brevundimonas sp.]
MATWSLRGAFSSVWSRFRGPRQINGRESSGTRSAITVTPETALQVTSILCGARVIAEGVAQVPLKLFEEQDDENNRTIRKPARDHDVYNLIAYQPNDWMTSFEFRETLTLHAVLGGGGFAFINRASSGRARELIPIAPDDIKVIVDADRSIRYEIVIEAGRFTRVDLDQILHIKGPSWNGAVGLNIVSLAREAIGLSVALERSQADLFGKGARPSGVLSTETPIGPEAVDKMRARWTERFGPGGDGGVALLDGNWKFESVNMTGVDSQQLESRRFQIEENCRAIRVFPQMVMQSDKASTFASAGAFFQAHVVHTIMPWTERWEGALKRDLIGWDGDNANIWPRFLLEGLMEGDPKARGEFYTKMVNMGAMSPNEVRAAENRNPRDGGDEFLSPMNMRLGNGQGDDDPAPRQEDDDAA